MGTWAGLKAHRARLRAEGKCTRCHRDNDRPDRALCAACAAACKRTLYDGRERWRADPRRCGVCSSAVRAGNKTCDTCTAIRRRAYRKAVADGKCSRCYRPMPEAGYTRCAVCGEYERIDARVREAVNRWRS